MADFNASREDESRYVETVATGSSGRWIIEIYTMPSIPGRWFVEIAAAASSFSDLHFGIPGPHIVKEVLEFIQQTLGKIQYSEDILVFGGQEVRPFTCPRLVLGQFGSAPVELYKDGAEDRYFLV